MRAKTIIFTGESGNILWEGKLSSLPLTEEGIISKSMEWFKDPEPCIIHRSAVMKRIYIEFDTFVHAALERGEYELTWKCVPPAFREILAVGGDIRKVLIRC